MSSNDKPSPGHWRNHGINSRITCLHCNYRRRHCKPPLWRAAIRIITIRIAAHIAPLTTGQHATARITIAIAIGIGIPRLTINCSTFVDVAIASLSSPASICDRWHHQITVGIVRDIASGLITSQHAAARTIAIACAHLRQCLHRYFRRSCHPLHCSTQLVHAEASKSSQSVSLLT